VADLTGAPEGATLDPQLSSEAPGYRQLRRQRLAQKLAGMDPDVSGPEFYDWYTGAMTPAEVAEARAELARIIANLRDIQAGLHADDAATERQAMAMKGASMDALLELMKTAMNNQADLTQKELDIALEGMKQEMVADEEVRRLNPYVSDPDQLDQEQRKLYDAAEQLMVGGRGQAMLQDGESVGKMRDILAAADPATAAAIMSRSEGAMPEVGGFMGLHAARREKEKEKEKGSWVVGSKHIGEPTAADALYITIDDKLSDLAQVEDKIAEQEAIRDQHRETRVAIQAKAGQGFAAQWDFYQKAMNPEDPQHDEAMAELTEAAAGRPLPELSGKIDDDIAKLYEVWEQTDGEPNAPLLEYKQRVQGTPAFQTFMDERGLQNKDVAFREFMREEQSRQRQLKRNDRAAIAANHLGGVGAIPSANQAKADALRHQLGALDASDAARATAGAGGMEQPQYVPGSTKMTTPEPTFGQPPQMDPEETQSPEHYRAALEERLGEVGPTTRKGAREEKKAARKEAKPQKYEGTGLPGSGPLGAAPKAPTSEPAPTRLPGDEGTGLAVLPTKAARRARALRDLLKGEEQQGGLV